MTISPYRYISGTAVFTALVLMCLCIQAALAANPWPTTQFKVDFSVPDDEPGENRSDPNRNSAPDFDPDSPPDNDSQDDWGDRGERSQQDHNLSYDVLAMFFESSLQEIAIELEQEGFEAPTLPVYNDGTGVYYKVNIFDLSKVKTARLSGIYHSSDYCNDPDASATAWFGINTTDFLPLSTQKEPFLYMVLAHELFHSVQQSYPATADALDGCDSETKDYKTVSEGTANGVAFKLTMKHWPKYYLDFVSIREFLPVLDGDQINVFGSEKIAVWRYGDGSGHISPSLIGWRSYTRPFLDLSASERADREQAVYQTASFWYNLIDRYDIQVIDHLLRQPLRYGDSPSLLQWLNNGLISYKPDIGGLYLAFPHFVTEFASQAGSRFPWDEFGAIGRDSSVGRTVFDPAGATRSGDSATVTREIAQKGWIEKILGECQLVKLVAGNKETDTVPVVLDRISAGCIEISWEGFEDNFELNIEAEHGDLRLLGQLNIGIAYEETEAGEQYCYTIVKPHYPDPLWTCLFEKPFQNNGPKDFRYARLWSDLTPLSGSGRRIYTISNVAKQAEKTRRITKKKPVMLHIGIATTEGKDGRRYDPPYSQNKGGSGMGLGMGLGLGTGTAETLYGISRSPAPAGMPLSIGVSVKGSDLGYSAIWLEDPPPLGYKGPFKGMLSSSSKDGRAVMSSICPNQSDGVIGQITRLDRDNLWIEFDADLCEVTMPPPANGQFPKVDHFKASLRFPFGWRYSAGSRPFDIVTPDMQVFIDRHAKRVPRVLSGTWNAPGLPGASQPGQGSSGTGSAGQGSGSAPGASSLTSGEMDCDCSCEERKSLTEQGELAKKKGDQDTMMKLVGKMMACMPRCQRDYALCAIEADKAEKLQQQALADEQKNRQADCDCSCEAIENSFNRAQELGKQVAAGNFTMNEDIAQFSQCASACQEEMIACAMKK